MPVQYPNEITSQSAHKYERHSHTELAPDAAPMSLSQASYLMTLCEEAGEILDDSLSQTQAALLIQRLEDVTGRGHHLAVVPECCPTTTQRGEAMFTPQAKTVADVMTRRLVTLKPDDQLGSIEEAMVTLRVRHLPVVDREGKLLGLISHADVWHAASSVLSEREADRNAIINQVPVARIMQTDLLTVEPQDLLVDVGKLMWDCKVGCVPVVERDGTLVGIITAADFIAIAVELLGSEIHKSDVEELARNRARFARVSA